MMKKADEHLQAQRQYDAEKADKLAYAKRLRQEEKDKQEALEVCILPSTLHAHN